MNKQYKDYLPHLEYELRLLLGASWLCPLYESHQLGNNVNYLRDSVYLHARNLYVFFSNKSYSCEDELLIKDFKVSDVVPNLPSKAMISYGKWKDPLHRHVMHLRKKRASNPSNRVGEEYIYDQISTFAQEIEKAWEAWIIQTDDGELKADLTMILKNARTDAWKDYQQMATALRK